MSYLDQIKNIEKVKITKDSEEAIRTCIDNLYMSHDGSEQTHNDIYNLSSAISDKTDLTYTDIETMCWLLDRYGFKDELRKILYGDTKIKTEYEE